jgi:hypothetical protein
MLYFFIATNLPFALSEAYHDLCEFARLFGAIRDNFLFGRIMV